MAHFILVGVGGGIAAYKTAALCSQLVKRGYEVQVLMTEHATRFIQPLTFQALTHRPVLVDTFNEPDASEIAHIAVADRADLYVIAPATANLLAKLAVGIADDMVTTTALAVTAPVMVAPAMNVHMFEHPTVQHNLANLRQRGVLVINPGEGPLACGYTGKGRLAEPEDIADVIDAHFAAKADLAGVRVMVSAGPTVEDIDPVRYLSNASSGKMGYALAEAAVARGAEVVLVSGPTHLSPVPGARLLRVRSTEDMLQAVLQEFPRVDVFISAAAPVDFQPVQRYEHKWKKTDGVPTLELQPTPDILSAVREIRRPGQVVVGFAAETRDVTKYARDKLVRKQLDLVVVNNVAEPDAGFGVDTNRVTFVRPSGPDESLPVLSKREVADRILTEVAARLAEVRDGER